MFNGDELLEFVRLADYVTVNDYEGQLLQERTGRSIEELAGLVKGLVVTLGARGSLIYADGQLHRDPVRRSPRRSSIRPVAATHTAPGLLYGIAHGYDWPTTGRLASLLGAIKIARRGGQNHRFTRDQVGALYHEAFGTRVW